MWIAIFNNLPELVLGIAWTGLVAFAGAKFGSWKARRAAGKRTA